MSVSFDCKKVTPVRLLKTSLPSARSKIASFKPVFPGSRAQSIQFGAGSSDCPDSTHISKSVSLFSIVICSKYAARTARRDSLQRKRIRTGPTCKSKGFTSDRIDKSRRARTSETLFNVMLLPLKSHGLKRELRHQVHTPLSHHDIPQMLRLQKRLVPRKSAQRQLL